MNIVSAPQRVMVVDDEISIRITFEAFLTKQGYDVESIGSAKAALALMETQRFDLVLLDIMLPGASGMELLEASRNLQPETPVIMISGRPTLETAMGSVRLGAFDYLQKPVERDVLLHVVGRALEHKHLLDERRRLQQELATSERKYRLLAENAADVIWVLDKKLDLVYISPAMERLFGYSSDQVFELGRDFFRNMQTDEHLARWRDWTARIMAGEDAGLELWQTRVVTPDGKTAYVESSTRGILEDGQFMGILGVSRDVTARKMAEEALDAATLEKERYRRNLEATFSSIPDAIIAVDENMSIISANSTAARTCRLANSSVGKSLNDVTKCESAPCLEALNQTLHTGKPVRAMLAECRRKTGDVLQVELNCTPLVVEDGSRGGAVLVVKDVTRLMDLEKRLGERKRFHGMIGKSEAMQEVYGLVEQLANVESTVLVQGETGTGKELVSEALHYGGSRTDGSLVKVNCSALTESLLESELFGHVRGAFTGALRDKEGRIQAAAGGTLMLDEIGDISPLIQLKLLRFLEYKEYERVGESVTRKAEVRVIAASNLDLLSQVKAKQFREDLYYRLNVMVITLPPLRERTEDIPLFVSHFLEQFGRAFEKSFSGLSNDAMAVLMHYPWPGNVRELKHTLEHACILSPGGRIGLEHLPAGLMARKRSTIASKSAPSQIRSEPSYTHGRIPLDKGTIEKTLVETEGNKAKAARILGIDRTTLYRKLAEFQIPLREKA